MRTEALMFLNCGTGGLLRVTLTAGRYNQSILKKIGPEYLLEELMLNQKLQYFGHLMQRTDLFDVQAGFRKGRGTRDQIANICWTSKKQESSRKTSISALLTMPKPLTVWIPINCGKF